MRPAILFLGRSGGYYYQKAQRREEASRPTFAGDGGCLNLTRAVGKLQTSHAHHSTQNDLAHSTGSARVLRNGCVRSYGRKTGSTYARCGRCFDDNSSWLHPRRALCILIEASACKTSSGRHETAQIEPNYETNTENIDVYNFAFFVLGRFPTLSRAVGEIESSSARQSTQNDLAHLTESARLPTNGCAGSCN